MDKNEINELRKKLDGILEKRKQSIPLTKEEEKIANEFVDKLYAIKFGDKKFQVQTGDEIRKARSFEGTPPKNRGFAGGYDSKADVAERAAVEKEGKNTAGEPTRRVPEYFSEEGKQTPTEDTTGDRKADYRTEEYADTDGKKYVPPYEEERLANQIEGQHKYDNSIRVKDIVVKVLRNDIKLVGQVLKIYKEGKAALVKWATGTMSHEIAGDLTVLKATTGIKTHITPKERLTLPSGESVTHKPKTGRYELPGGRGYIESAPRVRKHNSAEKLAQSINRANLHFGNVAKGKTGAAIRRSPLLAGPVSTGAAAGETVAAAETISSLAGHGAARVYPLMKPSAKQSVDAARRTAGKPALGKGEKPPSDWLDRCVERVKEGGGADEPYAVCTATYQRMKSLSPEDVQKDKDGNEFIKLFAEDFDGTCQSCADKMRNKNIKFLKVYIGDLDRSK